MHFFKIPDHVLVVAEQLKRAGGEVYIVGGAVRDYLLGQTPLDFDLATNFHPEQVMAYYPLSVGTGLAHGTVTVWMNRHGQGRGIEITTYRGETTYSDGRHPDSIYYVDNIAADLSRRDFTINAMAYDPFQHQLIDPFLGYQDLQRQIIRAVGCAEERFLEDGLRAIRAIRFATCLNFSVEPDTLAAIIATKDRVRSISVERIHEEWHKILLRADKPSLALAFMQKTQILPWVFPELLADKMSSEFYIIALHYLDTCKNPYNRMASVMMLLLHENLHDTLPARQCLERLRYANADKKHILHNLAYHPALYPHARWTHAQTQVDKIRLIAQLGRTGIEEWLERYAVYLALNADNAELLYKKTQEEVRMILESKQPLSIKELSVSGRDLMQTLNLPASEKIGQLLERLLTYHWQQTHTPSKEDLLTHARTLI